MKAVLTVTVEPKDIYDAMPPSMKQLVDSLADSIIKHGVFPTDQQAKDWAITQVYKSIQNIAKEEREK
jgi:hypothetical protein